jgi:molybdopterin-guanine dinucleotide biosynthesis protein A
MDERFYPDLAVAVLAGGASSRFGTDKALFKLGHRGPTLLERSVSVGIQLTDTIAVIGHPKYQELLPKIPVIADDLPGRGPLGGIATAFRCLDRPRLLVLGCDMPCLSVALLRWMAEVPTDADIVVPLTSDGRYQTIHAIYNRSVLPAISRALDRGSGAVISIYPELAVRSVTEMEMRILDPRLDSLLSLNRRQDIERAQQCIPCN